MKADTKGARRQFLIGAGLASTGAAVAVVAGSKPAPTSVRTSKAGVPSGRGYQVTEHVRNYYRTTAV